MHCIFEGGQLLVGPPVRLDDWLVWAPGG
jgi:hypothetical protein